MFIIVKIELKSCFELFDKDLSGSISVKELGECLEKMNLKLSQDELKFFMQKMDRDGSGTVDFNEFCSIFAQYFAKKPTIKDLEAAFDYFDTGKFSLKFFF